MTRMGRGFGWLRRHSAPENKGLEDQHPRHTDHCNQEESKLHIFLELLVPQRFSFSGAKCKRKCDHLSNDGGSLSGSPLNAPWDGPFSDNQDAHVAKGTEEEYLLGQPLENGINIVLPVDSVQKLQEDT